MTFHVIYTPSEELTALRREVEELQLQLAQSKAQARQVDFRYAQEVTINNRLLDFCRAEGVPVPRILFDRHPEP